VTRPVQPMVTLGLVIAALAVAGLVPVGMGIQAASGEYLPTGPLAGLSVLPGLPTPIRHVFLIMMENRETAAIYGKQPYETKLANEYSWGGDANNNSKGIGYYALCHPSSPNYLGITSGLTLQCNSDSLHHYSVNNLGHLLQTAGKSWIAYEEGAQVPCQEYNSGLYVVRHNPFPYYTDLGGDRAGSVCEKHDVPIANLTNDYPYARTPPAFTYIAPNVLDDGHSSSARYGDNWLSTFIPKLKAAPWFSSTAIFIAYDEAYKLHGGFNVTGYSGLHGGPVYMAVVSPYSKGVGPLHVDSSHYDTLATIEWLLGLPRTGTGHDGTPEFPAEPKLFQSQLVGLTSHVPNSDFKPTNPSSGDPRGDRVALSSLRGPNLETPGSQYLTLGRSGSPERSVPLAT
jgi:hypothetical protein